MCSIIALLTGCAALPPHIDRHVVPQPSPNPTYAQGFADGQRAARHNFACPDGQPILSGYISDTDLANPRTQVSWLPQDPVPPDAWWRSRRQNVDTINRNAEATIALQNDVLALLSAARAGRFCNNGP